MGNELTEDFGLDHGKILVIDPADSPPSSLVEFLEESIWEWELQEISDSSSPEINNEEFNLVLINFYPDADQGMRLLTEIRMDYSKMQLPVIVMAESDQESELLEALNIGANDFVSLNTKKKILGFRIKTHISLRQQWEKMQNRASTDSLTGLINRRELIKHLRREARRSSRYESPLCFALLDIDNFKQVNDGFGHQMGDLVLQKIASIIQCNIRYSDIAGRYGGDELSIILPESRKEEAKMVVSRLQEQIETAEFQAKMEENQNDHQNVTVSAGIVEIDTEGTIDDIDSFIDQADDLLYEAKNGRDGSIVTE